MSYLKIVYTGTVLVAIFLVSMLIRSIIYQSPDLTENETVIKHSLVELGGSAVVYLSIYNGDNQNMNYLIQTAGMSPERRLKVPIGAGWSRRFTWYLHDSEEDVSILIYKVDNPVPIENITYYRSKKR